MPKHKDRDVPEEAEDENESKTDKIKGFLKSGLNSSLKFGKHSANEAKRDLQKGLGLGHRPDVVPKGEADIHGEHRTVRIGWHPVAGSAGKWFAEKTIIGKEITERIGKYPDPSQHWAVIVGDYVHELWMDGNLDIIYINEEFKAEDWHIFEVGKTRFNDQALRKAGRMTIHNMREKKAAYNLISNNCQNFATNLLDSIQIGAHQDFATSFVVYQRATGEGDIKNLFAEDQAPDAQEKLQEDENEMPKPQRQNTLQVAQQVMDENTTKLDDDHD